MLLQVWNSHFLLTSLRVAVFRKVDVKQEMREVYGDVLMFCLNLLRIPIKKWPVKKEVLKELLLNIISPVIALVNLHFMHAAYVQVLKDPWLALADVIVRAYPSYRDIMQHLAFMEFYSFSRPFVLKVILGELYCYICCDEYGYFAEIEHMLEETS